MTTLFINRTISNRILELSKCYSILTIQGPRQSGKTTLCRALFPDYDYVNLEDPNIRNAAIEDPNGFIGRFHNVGSSNVGISNAGISNVGISKGVILDEIQRAPILLSSIQVAVDKNPTAKGLFILTGSAQLQVLESITQSLAGRTAVATLLPLSLEELQSSGSSITLEEMLFSGFYPRIHDEKLDPSDVMRFYVNTYVERDVRQILNVRDIIRFETFLRLSAGRSGQLFNASALGEDAGINHNTVSTWLSVLEASFITYRALPFHAKLTKRLTKAPKLFFLDVGLLCYLLGIETLQQLTVHPLRGAIFETFVAGELIKQRLNAVKDARVYFYRDSAGREVDLILEVGGKILAIEVKASKTFHPEYLKNLLHFSSLKLPLPVEKILVYAGEESFSVSGCRVLSYADLPGLL